MPWPSIDSESEEFITPDERFNEVTDYIEFLKKNPN